MKKLLAKDKELVKRVLNLYFEQDKSASDIAELLDSEGYKTAMGEKITATSVRNFVYQTKPVNSMKKSGRRVGKLKTKKEVTVTVFDKTLTACEAVISLKDLDARLRTEMLTAILAAL